MPDLDKKDAWYLAALLLLVLIFFHQFILFGRIPVNADWLHANFEPGRSYLPGIAAHNLELDDPVYQFHPLRMEAVRQWRSGAVPLWNPSILCGTPLLADGISKPLDPLIIAQLLFGGPVGLALELLLQFALMITGAYLLARSFEIPPSGAAVAAVIYAFNLLAVTWMELRTATGAFAFFPWAFLFLVAAVRNRSPLHAAAAALFAAFMVFAGHPQFVMYGFLLLGGFVLWRAAAQAAEGQGRRAAVTLGVGAAALALAVALSAVETIPFLELMRESARNPRQYQRANSFATPLSFLTYFFPNLFGNPARGFYVGSLPLVRPYMTAAAGFIGASSLALALAGALLGRLFSKPFLITAAAAVAALLLASGAGLVHAISGVTTVLSGMDVARSVFISNFALAMLAGAGAGALSDLTWRDRRLRLTLAVLAVAFALAAIVVLFLDALALPLTLNDPDQAGRLRDALAYVRAAGGPVFLWPSVHVPLFFFAAAAAVIALAGDLRKLAPLAAGALVAAELLLAGIDYNPFVPAALIDYPFPPAAAAATVPPHEGRVLGVDTPPRRGPLGDPRRDMLVAVKGDFFVPNTAALYGLHDVRGDQSLRIDRYYAFIHRIVGDRTNLLGSIHLPTHDSPFLDMLNARRVMSAIPLQGDGLHEIFSDGASFVYDNSRALPRAWLAGRWHGVEDLTDALNYMHERADYDPRLTVVVESRAPLPPMSPDFGGVATITSYAPSRVVVDTSAAGAAMLVLADAFYPGWRAWVDGAPAEILPACGALRAVYLPAGSRQVVLMYRPRTFQVGAALSGAAALALAAIALIGWRRRASCTQSRP